MRRFRAALVCAAVLLASAAGRAEPPAPLRLSMAQAIQSALRSHLDLKLAEAGTDEARARALQAAAALLPQMIGSARQTRTSLVNLKAQGFDFPGFASTVGPFNTFDARVEVSADLLDVSALRGLQSARSLSRAAAAQKSLAEEQVAAAAALSYVEAVRSEKALEAAQAGVRLARELDHQAKDQRHAGAASGVDVARSETRAAEEDLRFLQAQSDADEAHTRLKRVAGIPLSQPVELTDPLSSSDQPAPPLDRAVAEALSKRPELLVAQARLDAARSALSAARWSRAPVLSVAGDYGLSGNEPDRESLPTGKIGAGIGLPIFTSGRVMGRVREAEAQRRSAEARLSDLRTQVEEDVRLAEDRLRTAAQRVKTADQAVKLAERELEMARDRFAAGAASNVELVEAQTALARVQDEAVAALAGYQAARINLTMALGDAVSFRLAEDKGANDEQGDHGAR